MSLVPILYTSLILFSILMVVIISFSYIAYKIRNRNSEEEEVQETTYLQPSVIPERRSYQPQAIRVVPAIKNPELKKTYIEPSRPVRQQFDRTTVINNTSIPEDYSKNEIEERKTDSYGRRTNAGSFRSRLEIINRVVPEESKKEKFAVSGSGSIALPKYYENFRAIQYYSDEEDEYLYKPSRHYS